MDEPEGDHPPVPLSHHRLRPLKGDVRWIRGLAAGGLVLLAGATALVFGAPSPAWFLLYPLLIVGGLAALATAVAWLLRYL